MGSNTAGGRVVVISGPSGSGKTTVLRRLFEHCPLPLVFSVSATTRPPRPGETEGVDYHFLSDDEFARRQAEDDFLEAFEVYGKGYWYGTLRSEVDAGLAAGKWVVLEVDAQGHRAVKEQYPHAVTIFLHPGRLEVLRQRLQDRGTHSPEQLELRLQTAREEVAHADEYQYVVRNDSPDRAAGEICSHLQRHQQE